jgi:hypothetical protein
MSKNSRSLEWQKEFTNEKPRLPRQNPISMCIPRIDASIERSYISNIFSKLNIGYIERINEIPLRNDNTHKRVIIKIQWNQTPISERIQTRLKADESVKIVYDTPWYWKIVKAN